MSKGCAINKQKIQKMSTGVMRALNR